MELTLTVGAEKSAYIIRDGEEHVADDGIGKYHGEAEGANGHKESTGCREEAEVVPTGA